MANYYDRSVLLVRISDGKLAEIPTTITTVETQGFAGYTYPELLDVFPNQTLLERMSMPCSSPFSASSVFTP